MAQYDDFNEALKELGDIVNWTSVIENDMRFICKSLDNATAILSKGTESENNLLEKA